MSAVRIPARCVRFVEPDVRKDARCVSIELEMTEAMMLEALRSMLTRVSGETWARWVELINAEVTT